MLETASLPILLKAVDFLFDECKKVLEERRERRQQPKAEPPKPSPVDSSAPGSGQAAPAEKSAAPALIQTKESALRLPIRPEAWQQTEQEISHKMALLDIHLGNYRLLSKQYAQWGEALVPQIIANSLRNEETKILEIGAELQTLVSKVYAQPVQALPPEETKA